jgi:hypothetical protein
MRWLDHGRRDSGPPSGFGAKPPFIVSTSCRIPCMNSAGEDTTMLNALALQSQPWPHESFVLDIVLSVNQQRIECLAVHEARNK